MAYRWYKRYYKLTKEQKARGVVFSSALEVPGWGKWEADVIHEVTRDTPEWRETIDRLKDVSFFKAMARDFGLTVYEIQRS